MRLRALLVACAVAALLAVPAEATAEVIPFDPSVIESCLGTNPQPACIGTGAKACMAGHQGGSNVGIGMCFGAELRWWDAELNRTYAALVEVYTSRDAELDEFKSAAPRSVPALRTSQRAWIAWRDDYCAFEATTWGGGSGAGIAETECLMRLTGEQTLRLDAKLSENGG